MERRFVLWFDVWISYANVGAAIGRPRGRVYGFASGFGEYEECDRADKRCSPLHQKRQYIQQRR